MQYITPGQLPSEISPNMHHHHHQQSTRVQSNRIVGSSEEVELESPKVRVTRTQSAVLANKQQQQNEQKQTIFINHGDINININYPNVEDTDSKGNIDPEIEKFIVNNIQEQILQQ